MPAFLHKREQISASAAIVAFGACLLATLAFASSAVAADPVTGLVTDTTASANAALATTAQEITSAVSAPAQGQAPDGAAQQSPDASSDSRTPAPATAPTAAAHVTESRVLGPAHRLVHDATSTRPAPTVHTVLASAAPAVHTIAPAALHTVAAVLHNQTVESVRRTVLQSARGLLGGLSRSVAATASTLTTQLVPTLRNRTTQISLTFTPTGVLAGTPPVSIGAMAGATQETSAPTSAGGGAGAPSVAGTPYPRPARSSSLASARAPVHTSPTAPRPAPAPGGSGASLASTGSTALTLLALAGLLLLGGPRARRRLRVLSDSWRPAPFVLIPQRPG